MNQDISGLPEIPLWVQIWEQKLAHIVVLAVFLLLIFLVMLFKDRISKKKAALNIIRYGILIFSFVYVGLIIKAQPTTTNILIFFSALQQFQFPIELFLMEPFIFLSFSFIFLTLVLWGRGVFCGWLCPYGAMLELLYKGHQKLFPKISLSLPERAHHKLIYLKYVIFFILLGVSFYNFILSEYLVEIEPFRTFVLKLKREWYFVLYFFILTIGSLIIYRAFCRYLCPLGAALAVPAFFKKIPFVKMKRYDFCKSCKICTHTCTSRAVVADGLIDSRECLNCLDCQVNFWDEDICPVLIKQKKNRENLDV
jgi:NosR/NirI family nitrous oxide reductase transcriptional regulator